MWNVAVFMKSKGCFTSGISSFFMGNIQLSSIIPSLYTKISLHILQEYITKQKLYTKRTEKQIPSTRNILQFFLTLLICLLSNIFFKNLCCQAYMKYSTTNILSILVTNKLGLKFNIGFEQRLQSMCLLIL